MVIATTINATTTMTMTMPIREQQHKSQQNPLCSGWGSLAASRDLEPNSFRWSHGQETGGLHDGLVSGRVRGEGVIPKGRDHRQHDLLKGKLVANAHPRPGTEREVRVGVAGLGLLGVLEEPRGAEDLMMGSRNNQ